MAHLRLRWNRLMGIHVALGAVCLGAGACARRPLHDVLLTMGVILAAGFVPLIMGIYFMRGFLGIQ